MVKQIAEGLKLQINDLLDIQKIKRGSFRINPVCFNFMALLDKITSICQPILSGRPVSIDVVNRSPLLKNMHYMINSDEQRLQQIFMNFISNSIKFTQNGSIEILIEDGSDVHTLKITITDTGIGMAEAVRAKLFRPYCTFNREVNPEGTGLGLFITKQLLDQLGPPDSISVVSRVNVGSKFMFSVYVDVTKTEQRHFSQEYSTVLQKRDTEMKQACAENVEEEDEEDFSSNAEESTNV